MADPAARDCRLAGLRRAPISAPHPSHPSMLLAAADAVTTASCWSGWSDFGAAYLSGALSIIVGSPLDIVKVRYQAYRHSPTALPFSSSTSAPSTTSYYAFERSLPSLLRGAAAPVLGLGALNGLMYAAYNRTLAALGGAAADGPGGAGGAGLGAVWVAGAVAGVATWVVSAPTEIVKCRAQLADMAGAGRGEAGSSSGSSWGIAKELYRVHGVRGLYLGGGVTVVRDSVGYGFYFYAYELASQSALLTSSSPLARSLLAGGVAGIATWASIYPLDVIKTRVQTQVATAASSTPLLLPPSGNGRGRAWHGGLGTWAVTRKAWREGGARVFFDGLGVCLARAFVVNAVQWAAYEYLMKQISQCEREREPLAI